MLTYLSDVLDKAWQLTPPLRSYSFVAAEDLPSTSDGQPHLDVLTYNINFSLAGRAQSVECVVEALQHAAADIVFLQETTPLWAAQLECLHDCYPFRYYNQPTRQAVAGGSAVLSRWPLSNFREISLHDRVAGSVFPLLVGVVAHPTLGSLRVANVHLRPPLELTGGAGVSTARTTGAVRHAEAEELLSECPDVDLIAGDFNEQDGEHALARCAHAGLRDALAEYVPSHKETHRWPFGTYLTFFKRLDHIVYRPARLTCTACGVISGLEEGVSDHQPVIARFVAGAAG